MANHLKMATVQAIQALAAQGWSYRRIARELGIHRDTVKRYVESAHAAAEAVSLPSGPDCENRPNPPPGSDGQNRPNPPAGSSGPLSHCDPFREIIIEALEQGLSRQRIWQDLRADGFTGGYDSERTKRTKGGQRGTKGDKGDILLIDMDCRYC